MAQEKNRLTWGRLISIIASARLRALLSLGMVLGLGAVGTLAAWSTSAIATSGEFSTGSVDIKINGVDGLTATTPYVFTTGAVLPGKSVAQVVAVQNRGSLAFNYGVSVYGAGALPAWLSVSARVGGVVSNGACSGGTLLSTVSPVPTTLATAGSLSSAAGQVAANTGNVNFCVQVDLLLTAPNTVQGITTDLTLQFTATGVSGV